MIARWRDQLDRQIIVFVAFYVGNKKFPQKLLSRWRRLFTSSSSWTAPRPPGRRSSPCCKSMVSHVGLQKDRSWFSKRENWQNFKIPFDEMKHLVDENERHDWPLWDVLGSITLLGDLVVDKSELATLLSGRDSVQADVELSTVVRVRVPLRIRSCLGHFSSPLEHLVSIGCQLTWGGGRTDQTHQLEPSRDKWTRCWSLRFTI